MKSPCDSSSFPAMQYKFIYCSPNSILVNPSASSPSRGAERQTGRRRPEDSEIMLMSPSSTSQGCTCGRELCRAMLDRSEDRGLGRGGDCGGTGESWGGIRHQPARLVRATCQASCRKADSPGGTGRGALLRVFADWRQSILLLDRSKTTRPERVTWHAAGTQECVVGGT